MNAAIQQSLLASAFCLAGCAASPPVAETGPEAGDGVPMVEEVIEIQSELLCEYGSRTGTHLKERRCYTQEEIDQMSDKSREALRSRGKRGMVYVPIHPEDPRRKKTGN